jgi:hypothetical protein
MFGPEHKQRFPRAAAAAQNEPQAFDAALFTRPAEPVGDDRPWQIVWEDPDVLRHRERPVRIETDPENFVLVPLSASGTAMQRCKPRQQGRPLTPLVVVDQEEVDTGMAPTQFKPSQ